MSGLKGRYTTYVPVSSARNNRLWSLFNARDPQGRGNFYGAGQAGPQTNNTDAAAAVVAVATSEKGLLPASGVQKADSMFKDNKVNLKFKGTDFISPPDLTKVAFSKPGDPANGYVPNVASPGPAPGAVLSSVDTVTTNVVPPTVAPQVGIPTTYTPGGPGTGTASPHVTSPNIASNPLQNDMVLGQSSVLTTTTNP